MSKIKHIKIYWRTDPTASFVAEVVGRCNGACINGSILKEGGTSLLPEDAVSTISVGTSCYIFFSPAIRVFNIASALKAHPSIVQEEGEASGASTVRRFPKLWSKAIMDVFVSLGRNEVDQNSLVKEFRQLHAVAVNTYFGESNPDIDGELWRNLKRFVTKSPFEFDPVQMVIRFDASSVKWSKSKKAKVGSDDGEEAADQGALSLEI